jgi:hypothetical protein
MPGGRRWTKAEKEAYRSSFTIGRIVDEIHIVISIAYFALAMMYMAHEVSNSYVFGVVYLGGFAVLSLASRRFVPGMVKRSMPAELRQALPEGRFDGPLSPNAPHTYRELFRRWFLHRVAA